jgi:hypothetical protein
MSGNYGVVMSKKRQTRDTYSVSFTIRDEHSSDDIRSVSMNWENRSDQEVKQNLNIWLTAIGINLEVVDRQGGAKETADK